jgi:hypothetical protein
MKDSYYFPHDYHARHDPKNERMRMDIGPVGEGIYWDLVEMLYEQNGYLSLQDIPLFAKSLNTTEELIKKVISEYDLFSKNGDKFYSESLLIRLKHINTKRRKARDSANFRHYPNAKRTHRQRNAIKESKVNKIKESKFIPPTLEEVIKYCQERKNKIDPKRFVDFYSAKGWMIGKNKMKDWRAAVRTWEQSKEFSLVTPKKKPVRIQVLEMKALKIDRQTIKTSLLGDGYSEAEIDEAMGKEF